LVALDLLILLRAGAVITGEVKVAKGSTRSGHDLLKLLFLLLVFEVMLLLIVALVGLVIPVGAVVLHRGVELLPLRTVSDEVGGVTALKVAPK
jgi:hypothetical protein